MISVSFFFSVARDLEASPCNTQKGLLTTFRGLCTRCQRWQRCERRLAKRCVKIILGVSGDFESSLIARITHITIPVISIINLLCPSGPPSIEFPGLVRAYGHTLAYRTFHLTSGRQMQIALVLDCWRGWRVLHSLCRSLCSCGSRWSIWRP